ncbi:hypothetical protein BD626DRAFT_501211 [Schizophyllum amplum]|uniref:U1-type domain-containing protein n=1 Tax=Schizophyllum amplum TaxID=97359 RepID=A0A550C9M2_9AGAR|nr:hypothetical protein BD626DRAFT_501211 [Auriculariopsis ampla]
MADVRALLKAKRQQAAPRIAHPLALYTQNNQLQCRACNVPVKEFMWEGHVGSKKHRTAVARMREEQARAEEEARSNEANQEEEDDADEDAYEQADGAKRKKASSPSAPAKRHKPDTASGFPGNFFSDPTRQLPTPSADDEEGEDGEGMQVDGLPADQQPPAADDPLAAEYAAFMASVAQTSADAAETQHDTYERATGAPPDDPEETEDQKRVRIDKEIIMDRLVEEERAQEEADMRVILMKRRLEELKARKAKRKAGS